MDFKTGKFKLIFKDGQFPKGAPCDKIIDELIKGMADIEEVATFTEAGHQDVDTSNLPPAQKKPELKPEFVEETPIVMPEQQIQRM